MGAKVEFVRAQARWCVISGRGLRSRGVDGKGGRRGMNEISQLWSDLSHVMAGPRSSPPTPTPPSH